MLSCCRCTCDAGGYPNDCAHSAANGYTNNGLAGSGYEEDSDQCIDDAWW